MPTRFHCDYCTDAHAEILLDKLDDICARCNGIVECVTICEDCRTHDALEGSDQCLLCLTEMIVSDPKEFDGLGRALKDIVGRELARRCGVWFLKRQAA
jgi:hypothetical protein